MPVIEERDTVTEKGETTHDEQLPDAIKPISTDLAARMKALVKNTRVDLDEPIDGDVDL